MPRHLGSLASLRPVQASIEAFSMLAYVWRRTRDAETGAAPPIGAGQIGHSQMQSRPANSATPMSHTGQTGPELGFSLIAWLGRRDAARPQRTAPVIAAKGEQLQ